MNYLYVLGSLVLGFIIALIICYFLPKEKVKSKNQELDQQEQQIKLEIKNLETEYHKKNKQYSDELNNIINKTYQERQLWENTKYKEQQELQAKIIELKVKLSELKGEKETLIQEIQDKKELEKQTITNIQQETLNNMAETISQKKIELEKQYEKLKSDLLLSYTDCADEFRDNFVEQSDKLDNMILEKENQLNELRAKADAVAESNRRAELDQQEKDFYRLQLSDIDIEEIKKIRSIEPYLRNKEPLNKVIWKVYYEKPCTDLIARVIGNGIKTGIYKITNLENGLCYVGQAVDIASRWKQHIKRGIGAETPTRNKLYPAMLAIGVENFMFEVLEECGPAQLNEREDYYQEVYHAKEGYSIK